MNSFIETMNQQGVNWLGFAWPMLWQSSLLIATLFAFDWLCRRRLRAAFRYALWLVVLVKLCVPPTLALPTSPAWWLHQTPPVVAKPKLPHYTVTYDQGPLSEMPLVPLPDFSSPQPAMTPAAWLLVLFVSVSMGLLFWMLVRWWQITRLVRQAVVSERLTALVGEAQPAAGLKHFVPVKLTAKAMSPAVCGLFRPAILIPQPLAETFSDEQLRAVLLHELIHLRRRDVWLNFLQTLLQIIYWWHPLVWLANARIRRVREEAVDDAVMLALRDEADAYAPTLLEVAKLALNRPLATLGLVGILESRSALRQRIERLLDYHAPRRAGVSVVSVLGILAFTAVAVPMGEAPAPEQGNSNTSQPPVRVPVTNVNTGTVTGILTDPNFRQAIHALEQRNGTGNLAEPEVTTQTGHGENRISMPPISMPLTNVVPSKGSPQFQPQSQTGSKREPATANQVTVLVRDGKLLYEMGKFDEAKTKLGQALSDDPENAAAKYYLNLARQAQDKGKADGTRTNIFLASNDRRAIFAKLETIRLDQFSCDRLPLTEVLRQLAEAARLRDPEQRGVNFLIENAASETNWPAIDPLTGLPKAMPKSADAKAVRVTVFARQNITLLDALNAVVAGAEQPIHFKIEDFAVTFSAGSQPPPLFTRTFQVDPRTFTASLNQLFRGISNDTNASALAKNFFNELGVNWETPDGKAIFYKDSTGKLFVRATEADLAVVERALEGLNAAPPQIHIKARFLEVPKGTLNGLNQSWLSFNSVTGQVTAILSDQNTKAALRALQSRPGAEILAEPEVTTLSGRQTQMRATQTISVITNVTFEAAATNQAGTVSSNAMDFHTSKIETGPVLDVVPYVLADGYTINLAVIPSMIKFLGYDQPTNSTTVFTSDGQKVDVPTVLPHFQVRRVVTTVNLWDGQTVLLGGMPEQDYSGSSSPLNESRPSDKEILVFITANIVDPAGNRVHQDDELPFAQNGIPPQPDKSGK